jgi:hypothetical protein
VKDFQKPRAVLTKHSDMSSENIATPKGKPGTTTTFTKRKRSHREIIQIKSDSDTEQKVPPKKTKTTPTSVPEKNPAPFRKSTPTSVPEKNPPPPTKAQKMDRATLKIEAQNQLNRVRGAPPDDFQKSILKTLFEALKKPGMLEQFMASGLVSTMLPAAAMSPATGVQQPQLPIQEQATVPTQVPPSQPSEEAQPPTQPQTETEDGDKNEESPNPK